MIAAALTGRRMHSTVTAWALLALLAVGGLTLGTTYFAAGPIGLVVLLVVVLTVVVLVARPAPVRLDRAAGALSDPHTWALLGVTAAPYSMAEPGDAGVWPTRDGLAVRLVLAGLTRAQLRQLGGRLTRILRVPGLTVHPTNDPDVVVIVLHKTRQRPARRPAGHRCHHRPCPLSHRT